MRTRTPEQQKKFEEEQIRRGQSISIFSELLFPIFQQHDPESLISLNPESAAAVACRKHYDCIVKDVAAAMEREQFGGRSVKGLAYIIALASHIHYNMWSLPVEVAGIHHKMAEELHKALSEFEASLGH